MLESLLFHFAKTFHEPMTHRFMAETVIKMDRPVVIDAGAWLGDTAIQLAEANPECTVFAVEPSKKNCDFIRRRAVENVRVINKCLTSDSRYKCATDSPSEIFNNKTYKFGTDGTESCTVDEIFASSERGVQLVHLDVEGHEYDCLQGAQMCLESGETIFVVEILHTNEDKDRILSLFSNYGYDHFVIPENVGWWGNKGFNYVFHRS